MYNDYTFNNYALVCCFIDPLKLALFADLMRSAVFAHLLFHGGGWGGGGAQGAGGVRLHEPQSYIACHGSWVVLQRFQSINYAYNSDRLGMLQA